MKKAIKRIGIAAFAAILFFTSTAFAAADETAPGSLSLEYYGEIEVSAYYPAEDAQYPNNHRGLPLTEQVGAIVAAPTGHELIGKQILMVFEVNGAKVHITRKVDDTGCKPGRLDLLVENEQEMTAWGLRNAEIYVIA